MSYEPKPDINKSLQILKDTYHVPPASDIAALVAKLRRLREKAPAALKYGGIDSFRDGDGFEHVVEGPNCEPLFSAPCGKDSNHIQDHDACQEKHYAEYMVAAANAIPTLIQAWEEATARTTDLLEQASHTSSRIEELEDNLASAEKRVGELAGLLGEAREWLGVAAESADENNQLTDRIDAALEKRL